MDANSEKARIFSDQGIINIVAFSETLKKIHIRLIRDGYVVKYGKVYKPQKKLADNVLK